MVIRYKGIPGVFGTLAGTLVDAVMSATGSFSTTVTGTIAATLRTDTLNVSGSAGLPVSSADIATVVFENPIPVATLFNSTVTFGQYFAKGDVPASATIGAKIGGSAIQCNVSHKATFGDGSLRHAIISVLIPDIEALASRTVTLYTQLPPGAGSAITKDDILATAFDASVSCTIGGMTYTMTARELLDGTTARIIDETWLSGDLCSEFIVGGRLRNGAVTHAHLSAYFHVRAYRVAGSIVTVRCDVVVENGWTFTAGATAITYSTTVVIGGTQVYANANYSHYHHSRWHVRGTWGTQIYADTVHDTDYLKKSKCVPNYGPQVPSSAVLDSYLSYAPGSKVNLRANWGDGGADPQIGHLPEWDASYIKSGADSRAYNATIANSLAAASYSYHYRDENTGYPPKITDYPDLSEAEGTGGIVLGTGGEAYSHEPGADPCAHQPLVGYLAYILTGDYRHLEELHFLAAYSILWTARSWRAAGSGNNATTGRVGYQLRGLGWGLRTTSHAAAITPDAHQQKSYLVAKVQDQINYYTANYATVGGSRYHTLGAVQDDLAWPPEYKPWMADFVAGSMMRLTDLDFSATTLADWAARWPTGRAGQPGIGDGYCRYYAGYYDMTSGIVQANGTSFNVSFAQLFAENINLPCTPPGPNATVGWQHSGAIPGATDAYYAVHRSVLAMAAGRGVCDPKVWREVSVTGTQDFTGGPTWDIEPRFTVPSAISALAPYQCHQFPNSRADAINPCPTESCSYSVGGGAAVGFSAIMDAWSGGAYDTKRDRLLVFGGGHNDYYGNQVIAFDLNAGTWSQLIAPSNVSGSDTTTAGGQSSGHYADGKPTSRHTVNLIQYSHQLDSMITPACSAPAGLMGIGGIPKADRFNLATNTWSVLPDIPRVSSFEEFAGAWSATDVFGDIWVQSTTNSNNRLYKYDVSANSWSASNNPFSAGFYFGAGAAVAVDTKRNRMFTIGHDSDGNSVHFLWNLNDINTGWTSLSGVPSALNFDSPCGLVYDPIGDRLIAWRGGTTLYIMNCSTLAWSTQTITGANPGAAEPRGTYGRMQYVPSMHGIVLVSTVSTSVYFIKL